MATFHDFTVSATAYDYSLVVISVNIPVGGPYRIKVFNYLTGELIDDINKYGIGTTTHTVNYGTEGSTYYKFSVIIYDNYDMTGDFAIKYATVTTPAEPVSRPPYFYWTTAKTAGSQFNVTYQEWNRMINNLNDLRDYKNKSFYYLDYVGRGYDFSAYAFNELRYSLSGLKTHSLPYVYSGDNIYAWYFTEIQNRLNSVS